MTRATSAEATFAIDKSATKSICWSVSCPFVVSFSVATAAKPIGSLGWCAVFVEVLPFGSATDGPDTGGARIIGCCFSGTVLFCTVDEIEGEKSLPDASYFSIGLVGLK